MQALLDRIASRFSSKYGQASTLWSGTLRGNTLHLRGFPKPSLCFFSCAGWSPQTDKTDSVCLDLRLACFHSWRSPVCFKRPHATVRMFSRFLVASPLLRPREGHSRLSWVLELTAGLHRSGKSRRLVQSLQPRMFSAHRPQENGADWADAPPHPLHDKELADDP